MRGTTKKAVLGGLLVMVSVSAMLGFVTGHEKKEQRLESMQMNVMESQMMYKGQIVLRLANNHMPDYPTSVACDYFAELVEERSGGRIRILNYHSARLGDEKSTVEQVMYGGIDLARVSTALLTDYDPDLIALQMPYLYEDSEHMWTVLDSGLGDSFLAGLEEIGVEGLCWFDAGARNFYTVDQPIVRVEDLQGLRIRVQESSFMVEVIRALGAVPEEIPFDKVGTALKHGEIDGAENNFSSYVSTRHYTYAPNLVLDEHIRIPEVIIVNKNTLDHLEPEDREIIRQAAKEASVRQRKLWAEEEQRNREIMEAEGTVVWEVEEKGEFVKKVSPVYEKYVGNNKQIFQEIWEMRHSE